MKETNQDSTSHKKRIHSFSDDVLGEHDAVGLSSLLQQKLISKKEVIDATIRRAEMIQPRLRPIACEHFDQALQTFDQAAAGYFSGIPTFIKDLSYVEGLPVRYGSEAFASVKRSTKTDPIVKQIQSLGFVTLGTSTLPEFGLTCSTEFPDRQKNTLNPWDPTYTAGGSSGGAAVLVASGVVPIAHSADGGGSTRIPAACCGLIGLKASRGRLLKSRSFEKQLVEISIDGIVSRSVRDTAYFYAEAERYYKNANLPDIGLVTKPIDRSLNIGFLRDAGLTYGLDLKTEKAFNDTIIQLEDLGHTLKPVNFPVSEQMKKDFKLLWILQGFAIRRLGKFLFPPEFDPQKLTRFTKGLSSKFAKQFWKTRGMIKRLHAVNVLYDHFLEQEKIDILLTPTMAHLTPKIGHFDMNLDCDTILERMRDWASFTAFANVAGCPAISLPLHHDEETDLPIGIQFFGPSGQEKLLLALAFQLEEAKPPLKIHESAHKITS